MKKTQQLVDQTHAEVKRSYYSWLEDYLEQLDGKEAYREFQDLGKVALTSSRYDH